MAAVALVLLLALLAAPARAAEGLYLTWDDCAHQGAGSSSRLFDCADDTPSHNLYCALVAAQPIDSIIGMEIVVDLQVDASTLPDWWQMDVGGCRDGNLEADTKVAPLATCRLLWPETAAVGRTYTVGLPRGGSNQARIRIGIAVPSNQPLTMTAGDMYYAARLVLEGAGSVGGCPGCSSSACLVLNSILVIRPPRPVGTGDVLVTTPGSGSGNWASWQAASIATCQAVPVYNRTWGAVKSLYR